MATDQKINVIDAGTDEIASVIENELPAYRAISRLAVFSLIFGFLAIFSFAHWFFYLFAILAIVAGVAANMTIGRYSDVLTGKGLASAGIALGLIFGLAAGTVATVESYVRNREAEKFAKKLVVMLKAPSPGEAFWWSHHPDMRKEKTPIQYVHEVEAAKGKERMAMDQKIWAAFQDSRPPRRLPRARTSTSSRSRAPESMTAVDWKSASTLSPFSSSKARPPKSSPKRSSLQRPS